MISSLESAIAPRLSPQELAAWRGMLRVHAALLRELSAELEHAHGLSLSDYEVLLFLASAPEHRLRMSDLASTVLLSPSGITRLVDRLVADELVVKHRCDVDRRGYWAEITPAGVARLTAARSTHLDGVRRRFLAHLSGDDLVALARIWSKVKPEVAER